MKLMNPKLLRAVSAASITAAFTVATPTDAANWIQYRSDGYWLDLDSIRSDGRLTVYVVHYGDGPNGLSPPVVDFNPVNESAYDCAAGVLYHHPHINTAPFVDRSRWDKYYDDNNSIQFLAVCKGEHFIHQHD